MASKKSIAISYAWHLMWSGGECSMDECKCPDGRTHFEDAGPWVPSADRWPIPGRSGGTYDIANIRLAHQTCNKADGGRVGGAARSDAKTASSRENWKKADLQRAGHHPNARNLSHTDQVRGGSVGRCRRWQINRGLPCVCGEH